MSHTLATWDLYRPEIDAFIKDEEQKITPMYEKIFSVENTNRLEKTEFGWSGLSPMVRVEETGDSVEDENLQGYAWSYVRQVYRKHITFSSDLIETNQQPDPKMETMARELPRAVAYSRNMNAFGMIRNAFSSSYLWGDGKALASTAHPLKNGTGTQPNTFADGVQRALSKLALQELEDVLQDMISNSGNSMYIENVKPILWFAPKYRVKAFELAESELTPETDANAANYWKGNLYDLWELPYIKYRFAYQAGETEVAQTSADNYWDSMWGLIYPTVTQKYFKMKIADGYAKYSDEEIKRNQTFVKYASDKYTFGNTGFFGFVASKGDGTTYTG
jgi:hypothetical protein